MAKSLFKAPIDLTKHTSLIYAEGVFGLDARKKFPMRAKTADGLLRYAEYKIAGVVDSGGVGGIVAGDILPAYLKDRKNFSVPIFHDIKKAKVATKSDALIIGTAPEGGELPEEYKDDIVWAIKNRTHIVSGMHYALADDPTFAKLAKRHGVVLWDTRKAPDTKNIPLGTAQAYHIKTPIVLTVGMDAAIGKMTVGYEMHRAAQELGAKSCVIPTGQTTMMIEGWGVAIDALPADFMSGAVEQMVLEKAKAHDILFVEGQGSLFHPAYANTCISLIHGAVPTHMVLVARPQRKHSIGSMLVKLPSINRAIEQYEQSVLPAYRNAKVVGIATSGGNLEEPCSLPVFDAIKDHRAVVRLVKNIL
jgi:uncharacterized NAD-dependent epimerase/dehydratase family protein